MARLRRRGQGRRDEGFRRTPLQFYLFFDVQLHRPREGVGGGGGGQQADSDHKENEYLSYLDIHLKHLNQATLGGPGVLLIETPAVPDKLICLRNRGDINST